MTDQLADPEVFAERLLEWFEEHGRDLPWRRSEDPYEILICEVLLRRSRGTTVAKVTDEFFDRWPTAAALGDAGVDEVVDVIRPLGLTNRASQLVALGRRLAELGQLPDEVEDLCDLPGVGRYTAAATLGRPAVDGTSARVYRRYLGELDAVEHKTVDHKLWEVVEDVAPSMTEPDARRLNWAVLDLAASICLPAQPRCGGCPLGSTCTWGAGRDSRPAPP